MNTVDDNKTKSIEELENVIGRIYNFIDENTIQKNSFLTKL